MDPKPQNTPKTKNRSIEKSFCRTEALGGCAQVLGFVYLAVIDFLRFADCTARDGSVTLSLQGTESLINRCEFQLWIVGRVRACWLACLLGVTSWIRELRQFIA